MNASQFNAEFSDINVVPVGRDVTCTSADITVDTGIAKAAVTQTERGLEGESIATLEKSKQGPIYIDNTRLNIQYFDALERCRLKKRRNSTSAWDAGHISRR